MVDLRTASAVWIVSYLFFSWVLPFLADHVTCSVDGASEESMRISLADYSRLIPTDYHVAEVPFQRPVRPCQVFSDTYQEARSAFLEAAQELKEPFLMRNPKEVSVHNLTVWKDEKNTYTTDIVVLPGNRPGLVIHSSGVHGVEGYAGSAIQVAFLHLVRQFYEDGQLLLHPTIILVHALNPVGMAKYRRANEHNVDLNRNGLMPDEWSSPYVTSNPNRDNYNRFKDALFDPASALFYPVTAPAPWTAWVGFFARAAVAVVRHGGPSQLAAAMVGGQYHDPTGIFYGGKNQAESSLVLLKDWLEDFFVIQANNATKDDDDDKLAGGAVTWIDVHTGLGPSGADILLMSNYRQDKEETVLHMQQYFTADTAIGSQRARAVTKGYENIRGTINDYYQSLFSEPQSALIVTQEFGTLPPSLVGPAMILENAAYRHLPAEQALDWAKWTTKPAFYPQSSRAWRRKILERGVRTLAQAMRRSMELDKRAGRIR